MIRHILPKIFPDPSFPKRGIPPFGKGREEGFRLQRPYNYGLISNTTTGSIFPCDDEMGDLPKWIGFWSKRMESLNR